MATKNCPACGGENPAESVFCGNPHCHKALGEFRYVLEELQKQTRWHQTLMSRVSEFIGHPTFVGFHVAWIAIWVLINTGIFMAARKFDEPPFGLLGLILGIEGVLITSILVIGNRSTALLADKRAELDYEVNVQTYREIREISEALQFMAGRLTKIEEKLFHD